MLARQRGNPNIIAWNRPACAFQSASNLGILGRRRFLNSKDAATGYHLGQPGFIPRPHPGKGTAKPVFAKNNHRNRQFLCVHQYALEPLIPIGESR
jgi:hypothetical protein